MTFRRLLNVAYAMWVEDADGNAEAVDRALYDGVDARLPEG